jgi:hypothetical protein
VANAQCQWSEKLTLFLLPRGRLDRVCDGQQPLNFSPIVRFAIEDNFSSLIGKSQIKQKEFVD